MLASNFIAVSDATFFDIFIGIFCKIDPIPSRNLAQQKIRMDGFRLLSGYLLRLQGTNLLPTLYPPTTNMLWVLGWFLVYHWIYLGFFFYNHTTLFRVEFSW